MLAIKGHICKLSFLLYTVNAKWLGSAFMYYYIKEILWSEAFMTLWRWITSFQTDVWLFEEHDAAKTGPVWLETIENYDAFAVDNSV